jgi:hypothetical protein
MTNPKNEGIPGISTAEWIAKREGVNNIHRLPVRREDVERQVLAAVERIRDAGKIVTVIWPLKRPSRGGARHIRRVESSER